MIVEFYRYLYIADYSSIVLNAYKIYIYNLDNIQFELIRVQ